jgi:hypothetical protein
MSTVTREAVEILAKQEGMSPMACINLLQIGAARLNDREETLEALCAIKSQFLEEGMRS